MRMMHSGQANTSSFLVGRVTSRSGAVGWLLPGLDTLVGVTGLDGLFANYANQLFIFSLTAAGSSGTTIVPS